MQGKSFTIMPVDLNSLEVEEVKERFVSQRQANPCKLIKAFLYFFAIISRSVLKSRETDFYMRTIPRILIRYVSRRLQ